MEKTTLLKQQLNDLRESGEKLRNKDLADRLNISEAELLALETGPDIIRLEGDWKALLQSLHQLKRVMVLTRNEYCVHERKGVYENVEFYPGPQQVGVAVNPDIDLRFFMSVWKYGFAVRMRRSEKQVLYAFQFFDAQGVAVHKVFSTNKTDVEAYEKLVDQFRAADQGPITDLETITGTKETPLPDTAIDVEGFQQAWRELQDTHDFFGMLKRFKVQRTQGFRLAPAGFTEQVDQKLVVQLLEKAAEREVPIMCFVHSPGCVQIHTGPVKNLKWHGPWYNVLDEAFNLHLNMDGVKEAWIVQKPTIDGIVTSLELFDAEGQLVVYFFGARKPGKPELESWREIIRELRPSLSV